MRCGGEGEAAGEGMAEGVRGGAVCVRGEEDVAGEALVEAVGEGVDVVEDVDGLVVAVVLAGRHCQ